MALGFGGSVASLKATLTLDDDGFVRGMADASAKLDLYNAKLREEGVGKRFATMASREYAKQLYAEARGVDQATQSHGRLITTLQSAQRHWKLLATGAAGAGVGIAALTGHLGTLAGTALPAASSALTAILTPFTSLAAIVAGLVAPLTALVTLFGAVGAGDGVTLFGAVGAGAGFGLFSALTSNAKAFDGLHARLKTTKSMFGDLGNELGQRFLPWINAGVTAVDKFIRYADRLAHMSLPDVIRSISTQGMSMLEHLNRQIYNAIGRPLLEIFSASFGQAGNRISGAFAQILGTWKPLVARMWSIFTSWFDRQHFSRTGAEWAAAIVNTAVPVIASALWSAVKAQFSQLGVWRSMGLAAGIAFIGPWRGLFTGLLGRGKGLIGGLLGGAGGGGAVAGAEGAAGGAAAGGGGLVSMLGGAAGVAAIVGVAVPAALVYLSSRQSASSQNKFGITQGVHPRGPGSPGYLPPGLRKEADDDAKALDRVAAAEKSLNQYISDGGKSVRGWQLAVERATHQAGDAQSAIHDLAQKGIISADQAASQSKANLQNYISQEDAIARKATAASQNTAKFGASTRAQYAHVAALARTSADLAAAMGRIPSTKYVQLVVSIVEQFKTEGLNPGNARTQAGLPSATGRVVTGGVPNQDSVLLRAMPGEVVLSKKAIANHFGGNPYAADVLNFASGGLVPPPRHKKETRGHYRTRVSNWLANTVTSRFGALDFQLQLADRIAQRDDQEGKVPAELVQLGREQKIRGEEIALYKKARHLAHRFGFLGQERQYAQAATMLHQDVLDGALAIKNLKGTSAQATQQQIGAFLSTQQGFLSEFASNIILPGAQAVLSGGVGGGVASRGPTVPNRTLPPGKGATVIHQHFQFTQTPPDAFVHLRKARLAAAAVFGS